MPNTTETPKFGDQRQINLNAILNSPEKLKCFCAKIADWGFDEAMRDKEDGYIPEIQGEKLLEKFVESVLSKPL